MGLFIGGGAHNVIVRNLTLSDINPQVVWGGDALTIDNAEGVWIDHNTFARIGRQMIVTGRGSASHVTISNNEFDGHPPYSATCDGHHYWVWLFLGHHDTLTVSRNYIHDTSGRAPHAGGMGNADVVAQLVNNVFVYFTYQGAMKERSPMILRLLLSILAGILLSGVNLAAAQGTRFGVSRAGDDLVVNTGANLIFSVDGRNGDLVSMRFHGSELQSPEPKASQIASGLGKAKVELKNLGDVIVVSAQTGDLVHYYIAKEGRDAIYMATYAPTLLPVGELRFVTRLDVKKLPKADWGTDSSEGKAIEGKDVFLLPDGRTSSKFYSARPMIDDDLHGVHGPGVAVFMLMGNRELSSGGPFFKDITTQKTHVTQELYNYMYSSHTQTEPFRGGLHGVYDLLFTSGDSPPKMLMDLGFVDASLGLKGFLDNAGRGSISGLVSGVSGQLPATVGLRNAGAEYWTRADANGNFALTGLRPGHYQITLYDNELEVAQSSADITAGNRTHYVLRARTLPGQVKWQIGLPDGTPSGFRNARLLVSAHPSDQRMAPWQPVNYRVGTSPESDFPAVQWRNVNTPTRISFSLCPNEVHDFTLRIFITLAQFGGVRRSA